MIDNLSPLNQTFLATLFTWGVTALGSSLVFFVKGYKRSFLDASLGFASGVMIAASFWSLLLPALEIGDKINGENKFLSLVPVVIGFLLGAFFVYITDILIPENYLDETIKESNLKNYDEVNVENLKINKSKSENKSLRERKSNKNEAYLEVNQKNETKNISKESLKSQRFRRIFLLIIAVTVHNIPEGLAVGVGFGAIGKTVSATFSNARNLAIGIGIQNFPEGLAVSLPLYASGYSYWRSFWYGQLSGMVEPIAGVLGVLAVEMAQILLPYALSFAAGAMLYVVFDNLMPEAASHGNSKLSTWFCMVGFCVMMSLDFGLS